MSGYPPERRRRSRRMSPQKRVLLIVGFIFGGMLLLGLFIYLAATGLSSRDIKPDEMAQVINAEKLAVFTDIPGNRQLCEKSSATKYLDGSLCLEYEYDADLDPAAGDPFYLSSDMEHAVSVSSAKDTFKVNIAAMKAGMAIGGAEVKPAANLVTLGEERYAGTLVNEGGLPVGNMIVVRQGKKVLTLVIVGVYFDTREELEELLRPALDAAVAPR